MAKGIPTLKKRPRRAAGVMGPRSIGRSCFKLAVEMNHIAWMFCRNWGYRPRISRSAALRARKTKTRGGPARD